MARYSINLLGVASVSSTREKNLIDLPKSALPLLGLMVINRGRFLKRNFMAEKIWRCEEETDPIHRLNNVLHRLRKSFRGAGADLAKSIKDGPESSIGFFPKNNCLVDIDALEGRILGALAKYKAGTIGKKDVYKLERRLLMTAGDFCQDLDQDWAVVERERLRIIYFDGIILCSKMYEALSDYSGAIKIVLSALVQEPVREDFHRRLMRLYLKAGNRGLAIRQYKKCKFLLKKEFDVSPMPQTRRLYHSLLSKTGTDPQETVPKTLADEALSLADHLRKIEPELLRFEAKLRTYCSPKSKNPPEKNP